MNNQPVVIRNYVRCSHCGTRECSIEVSDYQSPVHTTDGPVIDITELMNRLPRELVVKIYNEYFRPVKFYQLYRSITTDTMYLNDIGYDQNKSSFVKHLPIFAFGDIERYLRRKDKAFDHVMQCVKDRGYVSAFRLIPEIGPSTYLELLMNKYH